MPADDAVRLPNDWVRYWCVRGSAVALDGEGFVADPVGAWGQAANPALVTFDAVENNACAVLLGEPGIGKSWELRAARRQRDARKSPGQAVLWFDLATYSTDVALVDDIFKSDEMRAWAADPGAVLYLYLDAFDESSIPRTSLERTLGAQLAKLDLGRLFVRIACRTANWPVQLEQELERHFGPDKVRVYELVGLRRHDVEAAATTSGLSDPERFVRELHGRGVVPIASRPVTLTPLLSRYIHEDALVATQAELYFEACRTMCEYRDSNNPGASVTLTIAQRMRIAGRLALVTLATGRMVIWNEVRRTQIPGNDLSIGELAGGVELIDGQEVPITEANISQVLRTSLFTARNANELGWVHQAHAEFLAGWYIRESGLGTERALNLLTHPSGDQRIIPQLREVAAWAAALNPPIFDALLTRDPAVLLRSDVAMTDLTKMPALVDLVLDLRGKGASITWGWEFRTRLQRFAHPDLEAQLRRWIFDMGANDGARDLAIDIAEANELQELVGDLVPIALDQASTYRLRVAAAAAVASKGQTDARLRLRPLLEVPSTEDEDDELRGVALRALWPDHIDAATLFANLRPAKDPRVLGMYGLFLGSDLVAGLRPEDLPIALDWARAHASERRGTRVGRLVDDLILRAIPHWQETRVIKPLAALIGARLAESHNAFAVVTREEIQSDPFGNQEARRAIVAGVIGEARDRRDGAIVLRMSTPPLLRGEDVDWLIAQARTDTELRERWLEALEFTFDWDDPRHCEAIFAAHRADPSTFARFAVRFAAVTLGSPEAAEMRRWHELREKHSRGPDLLDPPPATRVAHAIEIADSDPSAWWLIHRELALEPTSTHYGDHEFESDLEAYPGWIAANDEEREHILLGAAPFLRARDPQTATWIGTNTWHLPAGAGYRALRLLLLRNPTALDQLDGETWSRWAGAIVTFPESGTNDQGVQSELLRRAYAAAPAAVLTAVGKVIDQENREHGTVFVLRRIEALWDDAIAAMLLTKAREDATKPDALGELLAMLLDHDDAAAFDLAREVVDGTPTNEDGRTRKVVCARLLLMRAGKGGWDVVWPVIQADPEFGQSVVASAMASIDRRAMPRGVSEMELADLYIWLARTYPRNEDPARAAGFLDERTKIADFRDTLISTLQQAGTTTSLEAVERIRAELADLEDFRFAVEQARETTLQKTWHAPTVEDVVEVLRDADVRIVETGDQLVQAIVESLARLQRRLQGETPLARFLWNAWPVKDPGGKAETRFRPKDEADLADLIKVHLEDDLEGRGLVASREVQIHRGAGPTSGDRTDIHVSAVYRGPGSLRASSVKAILEVKGSWNHELTTAIQGQLVDRYLKDADCRHGVYVVGWYSSALWDKEDGRNADTPKDLAVTRAELERQSSTGGGVTVEVVILDCAMPASATEIDRAERSSTAVAAAVPVPVKE